MGPQACPGSGLACRIALCLPWRGLFAPRPGCACQNTPPPPGFGMRQARDLVGRHAPDQAGVAHRSAMAGLSTPVAWLATPAAERLAPHRAVVMGPRVGCDPECPQPHPRSACLRPAHGPAAPRRDPFPAGRIAGCGAHLAQRVRWADRPDRAAPILSQPVEAPPCPHPYRARAHCLAILPLWPVQAGQHPQPPTA